MRRRIFIHLALTGCVVATALAEGAGPGAAVAPFVDEQTFFVARVDVQRVDLDALWTSLEPVLGLLHDDERAGIETAKELVLRPYLSRFAGAGVREAYAVVSAADLMRASVPFFVIPLDPGVDAKTVGLLLPVRWIDDLTQAPPHEICALHLKNAIVIGQRFQFERLQTLVPDARPGLGDALAAVPDAAVQAVLVPPTYTASVLEAFIPTMLAPFEGEPMTTVTHGLRWAAAGVWIVPNLELKLVIQSDDVAAAEALQRFTARGIQLLTTVPDLRRICPNMARLTELLTPRVVDNRLVVALDHARVRSTLDEVVPAIARAIEEDAIPRNRIAGLHVIMMAMLAYAQTHEQRFPPDFAALVTDGLLTEQQLVNPERPGEPVGYVLVPVARPSNALPATKAIIAYEKQDVWPAAGVATAYADGHIEVLHDRTRLEAGIAVSRTPPSATTP